MSALRHHAEDYLQVRRALGYKLRGEGLLLASFVGYLEHAGASTVTTGAAVDWTKLATSAGRAYLARRMRVARGFARYLAAFDRNTEVPPQDLFPCSKYRPTPYIYTEAETLALMAAARTLQPPLRAATYEALIGLLASTGLRISEATALDRDDVDWRGCSLVVRESKYNKSREVLLHKSTLAALRRYASTRDRLCPWPVAPSFFVSTRGTRLLHVTVYPAFRSVVRQAGLGDISGPSRPKLHSFRHSFAVYTLRDWLADGGDVAARLPALSTYLGHGEPKATYWYFTAVPELLALAAGRLEAAFGELA
jgi:integrase